MSKKISKKLSYFSLIGPIFLGLSASCTSVKKDYQLWNNEKFVEQIKRKNMNNLSYEDEFRNAKFIAPFNKSIKPSNVMYQLTVYSFADGNNDGIGDFIGLNENLDYFTNLGIDTLYLSPIHPASSYHGYDVIDYTDVAPELGGMEAFDQFLINAHKKGIKVIMDWVINHTSFEHPWFQAGLQNKEEFDKFYNFYNFQYSGEKKYGIDDSSTRNLFYNIDSNQKPSHKRYVAEFWGGMPDLNLKNPKTRKEIINAMKFWVKKGVDGFRFDAFYYIMDSENNHEFKDATGLEKTKLFNEQRLALREVIKETKDQRSSDDIFFFGEWWNNPSEAHKYFVINDATKPYEERIGLNTVIDGSRFKNGFFIETSKKDYEKILKDHEVENHIRTWLPFLDNHDEDRWINKHYYNNRFFGIKTPFLEIKQNDFKALNTMSYGLSNLLIQSGNPILFNGNELNMRGGPKAHSDAFLREAFKWSNKKYQVDFYERRSGIEDSHISLNLSKNENSVEQAQKNKKSNFNLAKKIIDYRKENPEMFVEKANTYANLDDLFKPGYDYKGLGYKLVKAKQKNNKFLVLVNSIYDHTAYGQEWNLVFKNIPTKINVIFSNNSSINNEKITFNKNTGLMLVELTY
ncbi:alpha-amylase family glycosyl hydrolase [Mycoplasmopsis caviae]|uniref:Alpha-amylase n=1 Tax=Mycoplasmopsis caviae TaxID=55603 RepID=A0A3P8L6I3_9BACT|nr:alpha-amylase family glycosyl hydrolase [Mycoplasmopsis caviae]UUD35647.1 alpha-amylase family glycosyl hydrolase [Mycoplasmopsis caviae]VDR41605.1 Alpha-amylase precursor [Mycoplasmopsis caviae]